MCVGGVQACFKRSVGRVFMSTGWTEGGVQEVKDPEKAIVTLRFLVYVVEQKEGAVTQMRGKGGGEVWGKRMSPRCRCLGI